ncbi:MAG: hypothetical protein ACLRIS_10530 [Flavonifractor plautii]
MRCTARGELDSAGPAGGRAGPHLLPEFRQVLREHARLPEELNAALRGGWRKSSIYSTCCPSGGNP